MQDLRADVLKATQAGFKTKLQCDQCGLNLIGKFNGSDLMQLYCGHVFHQRCVLKSDQSSLECPICNNELSSFRSLQLLRQPKKAPGQASSSKQKEDSQGSDDDSVAAPSVRFVTQGVRNAKKETKEHR